MRTYKRALLAVWLCIFVMVGLLLVVAENSTAHPRPHHRRCAHMTPAPNRGEIQITNFPGPGPTTITNAKLTQRFVSKFVSIPHPAPYLGAVREIDKIVMPFATTFNGLEGGGITAPEQQPMVWELFRSGVLVYSQEVNNLQRFKGEEGKSNAGWTGVLRAEFLTPIPITSGQSLEWRFSGVFQAQAAAIEASKVFFAFNPGEERIAVGESIPAQAFLYYAETAPDWGRGS